MEAGGPGGPHLGPEASAPRHCGSLPGLSDLCHVGRIPLSLAGGAWCPLGRQRFSSGPHRPQPGCPSGAALRLRGRNLVPGPWSHAVLHRPRPGPTQRLLHHSGVSGCWTLGATAKRWRGHPTPHTEPEPCRPPGSRHSREVAGHPTLHTEPEPCRPRVTQQPVGSDVLRPGTRGGAGGLGLRALVWRPVSLRPARGLSPAAQARGSSAPPPPSALSAADPPTTIRGRCCFSQQCQARQGRVRRDGALAAHPDPESMVYGSRNCCHRDGPSQAHARPTQALPRGAAGAGQLPG